MRLVKFAVSALAIGLLAAPSLSQAPGKPGGTGTTPPPTQVRPPSQGRPAAGEPGGRPASRTGEKSRAAWDLEAKGIAHELSLSADVTAKLIKTYADARQVHRAALDKARAELPLGSETPAKPDAGGTATGDDKGKPRGGRPNSGDMKKATEAVRAAEAAKLNTALAAFLSPDQVTRAMEPMGTFDTNWDTMTNSLVALKLDEAKTLESQPPIAAFIVAYNKTRQSTDREANRTATQAAKTQLLDSLKKSMTDEQLTNFLQHAGPLFRTPGEPNAPDAPARGSRGGAKGAGDTPSTKPAGGEPHSGL